jgi:hypothetical protein
MLADPLLGIGKARGTEEFQLATLRQPRRASTNFTKARPEPQTRKRPGAGGGLYYRVEVRPKSGFIAFRTHDVGRKGHMQRVAGRRASGSWATVAWLIGKEDAHVERGRLVADSAAAKKLIDRFATRPAHTQGDRFRAVDRPNVPERSKPTAAHKRAHSINIKKARAARRRP